MAGRGNALPELLHGGALQNGTEFGLPHQERLQQRLLAKLEVRQHAQLFHRPGGEVLRFVNDQQAAFALACLVEQISLQRHQHFGLRDIFNPHTKCSSHHAQGVFGVQLRGNKVGGYDFVGVQAGEQATHNGSLAGPDLTSNDDETFISLHTVLEVGLGPPVLFAAEIETRIRVELKRLAA